MRRSWVRFPQAAPTFSQVKTHFHASNWWRTQADSGMSSSCHRRRVTKTRGLSRGANGHDQSVRDRHLTTPTMTLPQILLRVHSMDVVAEPRRRRRDGPPCSPRGIAVFRWPDVQAELSLCRTQGGSPARASAQSLQHAAQDGVHRTDVGSQCEGLDHPGGVSPGSMRPDS
jgi:hypothetical protein